LAIVHNNDDGRQDNNQSEEKVRGEAEENKVPGAEGKETEEKTDQSEEAGYNIPSPAMVMFFIFGYLPA